MAEAAGGEASRLERLWSGEFGDQYVDRNRAAVNGRKPFWDALLDEFPSRRVLEVGCNVGANLRWIGDKIGPENAWGLEINRKALATVRAELEVNAVWGQARELPFRDRSFDMVFTMGVLIHQPPEMLPLVMAEIVRCSRRFVVCGEYHADTPTEVPYRGQPGALWKRDFGGDYGRWFPDLTLRTRGFLGKSEAWDDVTYWVFERTG